MVNQRLGGVHIVFECLDGCQFIDFVEWGVHPNIYVGHDFFLGGVEVLDRGVQRGEAASHVGSVVGRWIFFGQA